MSTQPSTRGQTWTAQRTAWIDYLDALEASALAAREAVGRAAAPTIADLEPPAVPPGPEDQARLLALVALLAQVTAECEQHRDEVSRQLGSLSRNTQRGFGHDSGGTGERLDLFG